MANVVLTDLPNATVANNADITLLRQGLTDYQCAVSLIRNINVAGLSALPSTGGAAEATDYMLIARGGSNYRIAFNQVGLMKATKAWFFQATAPLGWTLISGLGDRLVACAGNSTPYAGVNGGGNGGTWQQTDTTLTLAQIPAHTHTVELYEHTSTNNLGKIGPGKNSLKDTISTSSAGGGLGHNHGQTWRPKANVGIICNKTN